MLPPIIPIFLSFVTNNSQTVDMDDARSILYMVPSLRYIWQDLEPDGTPHRAVPCSCKSANMN